MGGLLCVLIKSSKKHEVLVQTWIEINELDETTEDVNGIDDEVHFYE